MAQLDKASVYGTEESGFESLRVRQKFLKILRATDLSRLWFRGAWLIIENGKD